MKNLNYFTCSYPLNPCPHHNPHSPPPSTPTRNDSGIHPSPRHNGPLSYPSSVDDNDNDGKLDCRPSNSEASRKAKRSSPEPNQLHRPPYANTEFANPPTFRIYQHPPYHALRPLKILNVLVSVPTVVGTVIVALSTPLLLPQSSLQTLIGVQPISSVSLTLAPLFSSSRTILSLSWNTAHTSSGEPYISPHQCANFAFGLIP